MSRAAHNEICEEKKEEAKNQQMRELKRTEIITVFVYLGQGIHYYLFIYIYYIYLYHYLF